jgi:hypothetical protein
MAEGVLTAISRPQQKVRLRTARARDRVARFRTGRAVVRMPR